MEADISTVGGNRRRVVRRIAAVFGVSLVLGMSVWLTRPPTLVWWTSPPIGNSSKRLNVLTPSYWAQGRFSSRVYDGHSVYYEFEPVDRMPRLLRWLFPHRPESAGLTIHIIGDGL